MKEIKQKWVSLLNTAISLLQETILIILNMKKENTVNIKELSITARQEAFLEDYKKIAAKWGIDFQPAYRIVDLFAIAATETQLEGIEESDEIEQPEISKE